MSEVTSLRAEVFAEATRRLATDPAFAFRFAMTRQIGTATDRIERKGLRAEEWPAIALVLAERALDGGVRENDPKDLMEAVGDLLVEVQRRIPHAPSSPLGQVVSRVQQALRRLE